MPTPSKFVAPRRRRVLEVLSAGGSRREAARAAGIDPATLHRWIARGAGASSGSAWRRFRDQVLEAEANPRPRALIEPPNLDDPAAAWRFLEASGELDPPQDPGPVVISLTFPDSPRPE